MTCKNCNNRQEDLDEYNKKIDICIVDGHEVRKSIESCNRDTSENNL